MLDQWLRGVVFPKTNTNAQVLAEQRLLPATNSFKTRKSNRVESPNVESLLVLIPTTDLSINSLHKVQLVDNYKINKTPGLADVLNRTV